MTVMPRKTSISGDWIELPLTYNDDTETDTFYDLPIGGVIHPWEMYLVVDTVDAGETIDVGIGMSTETGYDANGFIAAYSIATEGFFRVSDMYTCTDGSQQNYVSANYIGALFKGGLDGGDAAGTAGIFGLKSYRGDGTCKSICYTCSADSDAFIGRLIFRVHFLPL